MKANHHLRMIWAIAWKDIGDALRNKTLLVLLIGAAFMMISSQALGLLLRNRDRSIAYYYDPGNSERVRALTRSDEFILIEQDDLAQLLGSVGASPEPVIGLVIPSDLDRLTQEGSAITLPAYRPYWMEMEGILPLAETYEDYLDQALGTPVVLNIENNIAYVQYDSRGYPEMIARGMVLGVMLIGVILTPYLIIDERISHTLDALLLSPASYFHMLAGKVITGIVYSLAGSLVIYLFSWRWFMHWEISIPSVILGGVCAASIGLLLGTLHENSTTLNMSAGLIAAILLLPLFMLPKLESLLAPTMPGLLYVLPSISMYRLIRLSFTEHPDYGIALAGGLALVGISLLALLLATWRIHRLDR